MNVKLIGFTPHPEIIPAMAAKLTHSKTKPENLEKSSEKELALLLEQVMKLGHTSVVEHTTFTFTISDVSRSLTHQLVRHRIASYSQQSQRYVNLNEPNYVIPPKIEKGLIDVSESVFDVLTKVRKSIISLGFNSEQSIKLTKEVDDGERKVDFLYRQLDLDIITSGSELPLILTLRDIVQHLEDLVDRAVEEADLIRILAL